MAWGRNGFILYGGPDGIYKISENGGNPQRVTRRDLQHKEMSHGFPQFLPDGNRFLFFIASPDPAIQGTFAASLDRPEEKTRVLGSEQSAIYAPLPTGASGALLFVRDQTLMAQRFDPGKIELIGEPSPVERDIATQSFRAGFWISESGLLVYRSAGARKQRMTWFGRDGKRLAEVGPEDNYEDLRLSPDGKMVAISRFDRAGNSDIWLFEFAREVMTRLTFEPSAEITPAWSPDGSQIVFRSNRTGVYQLYRMDIRGSGRTQLLTQGDNPKTDPDWSSDGLHLLYSESDPRTTRDVWALPLAGSLKPFPLFATAADERSAHFSPDGKWIAYGSNESGRREIYIRSFPPSASEYRWQVTNQGGNRVRWRGDGKEILFVSEGHDSIWAAGIRRAGDTIQSEAARQLFSFSPLPFIFSPYDVTADGERFLVLQPAQAVREPLHVTLNWHGALKPE
jgi:Tol biopolymer transport system component